MFSAWPLYSYTPLSEPWFVKCEILKVLTMIYSPLILSARPGLSVRRCSVLLNECTDEFSLYIYFNLISNLGIEKLTRDL